MTDRILELAAKADLITSAGIVHYAYADRLERFAALVRRDALEEAAVCSWSHYMETCKKAGFSPASFDKFIAADAIRAAMEADK